MSEKVRNYDKESIEVCRNCKGTGVAYTVPKFHPPPTGKKMIRNRMNVPFVKAADGSKRR